MQYVNKSFTLPAAPAKITAAQWERIFRPTPEERRAERITRTRGNKKHPLHPSDCPCSTCTTERKAIVDLNDEHDAWDWQ